jgi:hypothetical protein
MQRVVLAVERVEWVLIVVPSPCIRLETKNTLLRCFVTMLRIAGKRRSIDPIVS